MSAALKLTSVLTAAEKQERSDLEMVVRRGLSTFVDVGDALLSLKAKKLYRETHRTWEMYCLETFQLQKSHIVRLMRAAETFHNISPQGELSPSDVDEKTLRPLSGLSAVTQNTVWAMAAEKAGRKPSDKQVQKALSDVMVRVFESLPAEDQTLLLNRERKRVRAEEEKRLTEADMEKAMEKGSNYLERSRKEAVKLKKYAEADMVDGDVVASVIEYTDALIGLWGKLRV